MIEHQLIVCDRKDECIHIESTNNLKERKEDRYGV